MMARYTINWNGVDYPVPEQGFFETMGRIEDVVTYPELLHMSATGQIKYVKLASAAHELLKHCGVPDLPDRGVLKDMLVGQSLDHMIDYTNGEKSEPGFALRLIEVLEKVMTGDAPSHMRERGDVSDVKKTKPRSSKPATKSRSGNGASRRKTSGK